MRVPIGFHHFETAKALARNRRRKRHLNCALHPRRQSFSAIIFLREIYTGGQNLLDHNRGLRRITHRDLSRWTIRFNRGFAEVNGGGRDFQSG